MTQPTPDFAGIRAWYEAGLPDLLLRIERDEATPEHVQAFGVVAGIFQIAIITRNSDQLIANALHSHAADARLLKSAEQQAAALERIATALEALAGKGDS